jgi:phenylacetic acid degradation operon negative regulatory protein
VVTPAGANAVPPSFGRYRAFVTTLIADLQATSESRGLQPRALIVTTYGAFAREAGGWLSVASLIRLMAELDVDEPAVRSSISRLKRRGILEAAKLNGSAGYALSEQAREILAEGDRRIFERPVSRLSDGWVLAVFSVPESERDRRHVLRSRLTWLGFGAAAPGVWIAPAHLYEEAREVLKRLDLIPYVNLFRGEYLAFDDIRTCVEQWWNLEALQRMYDDFLTSWQPVLARWRRRHSPDDGQAFADYVRALTQWRRLPFLDPGLPVELLPDDWHGSRAADLFESLQRRLHGPAHRHVREVTARPGRSVPGHDGDSLNLDERLDVP